MKHTLLSFFLLASLVFSTTAQPHKAPPIQWQNAIGEKTGYFSNTMSPTKDGGFIITGSVDSANAKKGLGYHGQLDVWLAKLDAHCNIEWQKYYGGSRNDGGSYVQQTNDGGYIIASSTGSKDGDIKSNYHGNADYWIIKVDKTGNIEWEKCLGGSDYDFPRNIHQTKDGGYIILGDTESNDGDVTGFHSATFSTATDGWVVKLSSAGSIEWQKCLGGTGDEIMFNILQSKDGSYITIGNTTSNDGDVKGYHGNLDGWAVNLSSSGNIQWQHSFGGSCSEGFNAVAITANNGFLFGGFACSNDGEVTGNHGGQDMWVVCTDSLGNLLWQKCYGGSQNEPLYALLSTSDNGFIFTGPTQSVNGDVIGLHGIREDYWVVKADSIGNIQWQKSIGGSFPDLSFSILQTPDQGYLISGLGGSFTGDGDVTVHYEIDSTTFTSNWWMVKLAPEISPIYINNQPSQLQLFPNPAHNYVGIATKGTKQVCIVDITGKRYFLKQVENPTKDYSYFNIQYLAKGMYLVQALGEDGNIKVGKLIIE